MVARCTFTNIHLVPVQSFLQETFGPQQIENIKQRNIILKTDYGYHSTITKMKKMIKILNSRIELIE